MVNLFITDISSILEKSIESYKEKISYKRYEKALKYVKKEDKLLCVAAELLLNKAIKTLISDIKIPLNFEFNKYGKVYLKDYKDIFFNLSHSGKYVVCAISKNEVGVDIQKKSIVNLNLAKRYFSKEEYLYLMNKEIKHRQDEFFRLWTIKESFVKMIGKGLNLPLDSFFIKIDDDLKTIEAIQNSSKVECYFKEYSIDNDYRLAVCNGKNDFCENLNYINLN